jgi:hypothetical protein
MPSMLQDLIAQINKQLEPHHLAITYNSRELKTLLECPACFGASNSEKDPLCIGAKDKPPCDLFSECKELTAERITVRTLQDK